MADHSVMETSRPQRGHQSNDFAMSDVPAKKRGSNKSVQRPSALQPTQRRVRTPELALGLLLAAGCGLGAVMWTASASSTTPALVLAVDVKRGEVLELTDFAPAEARTTGLRLVAFSERNDYVGRIAAIDMPAASAITDSVALKVAPIADGEGLTAIRVEAGQYPTGLRAGSVVEIVGISDPLVVAAMVDVPVVVDSIVPLDGAVDQIVVTVRVPQALAIVIGNQTGLKLVEVAG
jgi:hypothetical protein